VLGNGSFPAQQDPKINGFDSKLPNSHLRAAEKLSVLQTQAFTKGFEIPEWIDRESSVE